jgi:hypothetical protein
MDDARFDALARALAGIHSRRGLSRFVGALALSGPPALTAVLDAMAGKRKKRKKRKRCKKGGIRCGRKCVDSRTNLQHCGGCDRPCRVGATCVDGACREPCRPDCAGRECGSDGCDGSCGTCPQGTFCTAGRCATTCPEGERACRGECIPGGQCCTDGECSGSRACRAGTCECPQAAAPHWCASANACVPACRTGLIFDPARCTCECIERSCCQCTGGNNPFCSYSTSTLGQCTVNCQTINPGGTSRFTSGIDAGSARTVTCRGGLCEITCSQADRCRGEDACKGEDVNCGPGGGHCFQPLGGGPTRCGIPTATSSCGCASHQQCANAHGAGAFCVEITGPDCRCGGSATFCAIQV